MIKDAPPSGHANLQVINSLDCPVSVTMANNSVTVASHEHSAAQDLLVGKNATIVITPGVSCRNLSRFEAPLDMKEKEWYNFVISSVGNRIIGHTVKQNVTAPPPGKSKLCMVLLPMSGADKTFDVLLDKDRIQEGVLVMGESKCSVVSADHYKLTLQGRNSSKVYLSSKIVVLNGGIYTAVVQKSKSMNGVGAKVTLYKDLEPRNVSMLYQIPQYFVITSGEILFSITGEYVPLLNSHELALLI